MEFLSEFDIKISYIKGTENARADAPSRRPNYEQTIPAQTQAVFRQTADGTMEVTRRLRATSRVKGDHQELRRAQQNDDVEGEEITHHAGWTLYNGKLYVPEGLRERTVRDIHEGPSGGHQGVFKTHERVNRLYDFPGIRRTVRDIVKQCDICNKAKASRHKPYGELQALPVPERPWTSVSLDFITKLPTSKEPGIGTRFDGFLVIVDRLSKNAYFIPFQEISTAGDMAYVFLRHLVSNHGLPEEIVSNRDKLFTSKFWTALIKQLGNKHKLSTAYHPQTDGQTERTNQTLEQYLRSYVSYQQDDWVRLLPLA